jgi:hypothetical protein
VHLSGRNVDEALLKTFAGSEAEVVSPAAPESTDQDRCGFGHALARLLQDPATVRFLSKRGRELGLTAG